VTNANGKKIAAVTGAAGGLGVCYARKLAQRGYDLVLVDRREEPLAQVAAEVTAEYGVAARAWTADLADAADLESLAVGLAELPGLDLLVNNAGFGVAKYFVDADVQRLLDMHRVHVLAAVRLTHAVLPGMLKRDCGAIVNMSSLCAWTPCAGVVSYASTKAYLLTFSQALHDELRGTNVNVQALCPAFVYTGFHTEKDMKGFDPKTIPGWMWMTPEAVVECSLRNVSKKRVIVAPGWRTALLCRVMQMPLFQPIVRALVRQPRS
jgi:uncharacterized protein